MSFQSYLCVRRTHRWLFEPEVLFGGEGSGDDTDENAGEEEAGDDDPPVVGDEFDGGGDDEAV